MAWDRYVAPFSYGLWLAVVIAVCALSVCLALTNYGHDSNQGLTVPAVLFYIHACFCQQGEKVNITFSVHCEYNNPYKLINAYNLNKISSKHINPPYMFQQLIAIVRET
jgi:hypothetical protein